MTDATQPTLDALYTRVQGRLEELHAGNLSFLKELIRKNQELQWDVDRLKKEIEFKNKEIDKWRQGRGLTMHDVWCGAEQERWLGFDFTRYAPEWQLHAFLKGVTQLLVEQGISNDEQFQAAYEELKQKKRRQMIEAHNARIREAEPVHPSPNHG